MFEIWLGFVGGETSQCYPAPYQGTVPIESDGSLEDGYHFTKDMTDRSIDWT